MNYLLLDCIPHFYLHEKCFRNYYLSEIVSAVHANDKT